MKQVKLFALVTLASVCFTSAAAQNINWRSLQPGQKHIINLNAALDNSTSIGIGYGYHFNTKMPLVLSAQYSMPFGNNVFDDFKTKLGAQLNVLELQNVLVTLHAYGIIRRYENSLASMFNFGSEFATTVGYYKKTWWIAGDFGFDKAIVTNIKHSEIMKEYNPGIQSGWYIPTGGNFIYGLQGGYSFSKSDVSLKISSTMAQDFNTKPMVPYYAQVGWNWRF